MRRLSLLLALATILTAAACGTSTSMPTSPAGSSTSSLAPAGSDSVQIASPADWPTAPGSAAGASAASTASPSPSLVPDDTVWLCKPGLAANPCEGNLDATGDRIDREGILERLE